MRKPIVFLLAVSMAFCVSVEAASQKKKGGKGGGNSTQQQGPKGKTSSGSGAGGDTAADIGSDGPTLVLDEGEKSSWGGSDSDFEWGSWKPAKKREPYQRADALLPAREGDAVHAARFLGDQVDYGKMEQNLKYLTGMERWDRGGGKKIRITNRYSDANRALSREFLVQKLRDYGMDDVWIDEFGGGANVMARKRGTNRPNEVVGFSAHYDSQGPHVVGADDNGSGVVAGLEIARILAKTSPERTIEIAFPDLEERGMGGSDHHADRIEKNREERYAGVVVADWIGHSPRDEDFKIEFEVGEEPQNRALANALYLQHKSYNDRKIDFFPVTEHAMPMTGDHGNYWDREIPATFHSQYLHETSPHYHKPTDDLSTINPDYLKAQVRVMLEGIASMAGANVPAEMMPQFQRALPGIREKHVAGLDRNTDFLAEARPDWQHEQREIESRAKKVIAPFADYADGDEEARKKWNAKQREIRQRSKQIIALAAKKHLERLGNAIGELGGAKTREEFDVARAKVAKAMSDANRQWDISRNPSPGELCDAMFDAMAPGK